MKISSYIRRIDDLGRIVIPKEIRRSIHIKKGDTLQISINSENNVVISKYSFLDSVSSFAQELVESMNVFTKNNILIIDKNEIIACSGTLKNKLLNKPISDELLEKIIRREKILQNHKKELNLIVDKKIKCSYVNNPIVINGESVGLVMILSEKDILTDFEMRIVEMMSLVITKYLDEYK